MTTLARESRLHERLGVSLARDIVAGRRAEGSFFPSAEDLAREADVSRTVSREAVQALAAAGLIRVQHGKRTTVNGVSNWRFLEPLVREAVTQERLPARLVENLYETRTCVESEGARLCALRASDEELAGISESVTALQDKLVGRQVDSQLLAELVTIDREFHAAIAEGSGNVVLARIAEDVHRGLVTAWTLEQTTPEEIAEIAAQHRAIAAALAARDPEGAAAAVRDHGRWSFEHIRDLASRG